MTIWRNVIADTYYADRREPVLSQRGVGIEVRIDESEIVVSYEDEDGIVIYRGNNDGSGHFALNAPERDGKASLHRFPPDGNILEGSWVEDGARGMWRIELREPDQGEEA